MEASGSDRDGSPPKSRGAIRRKRPDGFGSPNEPIDQGRQRCRKFPTRPKKNNKENTPENQEIQSKKVFDPPQNRWYKGCCGTETNFRFDPQPNRKQTNGIANSDSTHPHPPPPSPHPPWKPHLSREAQRKNHYVIAKGPDPVPEAVAHCSARKKPPHRGNGTCAMYHPRKPDWIPIRFRRYRCRNGSAPSIFR